MVRPEQEEAVAKLARAVEMFCAEVTALSDRENPIFPGVLGVDLKINVLSTYFVEVGNALRLNLSTAWSPYSNNKVEEQRTGERSVVGCYWGAPVNMGVRLDEHYKRTISFIDLLKELTK